MCVIFVIDEELSQRTVICSAFEEKLNYRTFGFSSVNETTNHLNDNKSKTPDIIILDISRATNYCKAIEELNRYSPDSTILVLTKYGDYENALIAINAGAHDFLTKPVSITRFSITLRNLLAIRNIQKDKTKKDNFKLFTDDGNIRMMSELEDDIISCAMQHYNGKMTEVARRLGIGRSTLYRKSEQKVNV